MMQRREIGSAPFLKGPQPRGVLGGGHGAAPPAPPGQTPRCVSPRPCPSRPPRRAQARWGPPAPSWRGPRPVPGAAPPRPAGRRHERRAPPGSAAAAPPAPWAPRRHVRREQQHPPPAFPRRGGTMSRGDAPTDPPGTPLAVPAGWQRKVEEGSVLYISPSGAALTSLEQTRAYLLAEGTCKCGLRCPLDMHQVFNFDPVAAVAAWEPPGARGQRDMTNLCNHRRKAPPRPNDPGWGTGCPHPPPGPGPSPVFSVRGGPAVPPGTGAKPPEDTVAPPGTRLVAPPFPQPLDVVPRTDGVPQSRPPGLRLPSPDAVAPPRSPGAAGRTPRRGGAGGSRGPGGFLLNSPPGDAFTSITPPAPFDAVPQRGGFWGLSPASPPFPRSQPDPPAPPNTLLSLLGGGAQWPQPPAATGVPPDPQGVPPAQPLAALLSLQGARPGQGEGTGGSSLPLCPLPAVSGSPCAGTGLLPPRRDPPGRLRGLSGPMVAASGPAAGTSPRSKASGRDGSPGAAASPGVPKGAVAPGAGGTGGAAPQPVASVGQEQAWAGGASLLPTPLPPPPAPGEGGPEAPQLLPCPPALLGPPEPPPLPHLAAPPVAPTSAAPPETPGRGGRAPGCPPDPPEHLDTVLLGNPAASTPLLQNQPLLPPPGPSLGASGDPPGLLQSLRLPSGFGPQKKSATPSGPCAGAPPGPPSALEPPPVCLAPGGPLSCPPPKQSRRRAEGLSGETPSLRGPPGTKPPRGGSRRHLNGRAGGKKGVPPPAPPPAWRCKGDVPGAEQRHGAEEVKGTSRRLRPSRRGWRRELSPPQPSAPPEPRRGLSTGPGPGPAVAAAQPPWPRRTRRRKLLM